MVTHSVQVAQICLEAGKYWASALHLLLRLSSDTTHTQAGSLTRLGSSENKQLHVAMSVFFYKTSVQLGFSQKVAFRWAVRHGQLWRPKSYFESVKKKKKSLFHPTKSSLLNSYRYFPSQFFCYLVLMHKVILCHLLPKRHCSP